MTYETINARTITVCNDADAAERTLMVVDVLYSDGDFAHAKTFEFDVSATEDEMRTAVEEAGLELKNSMERVINISGVI